MRRYDDPVEVRAGLVAGAEGPEQFLWRGRLWKVRAVLAHWVETGPWWQASGVRAVLGEEPAPGPRPEGVAGPEGVTAVAAPPGPTPLGDLLVEREVWRVEAGRGGRAAGGAAPAPVGVFELVLDWADGRWRLVGCAD